MVYNKERANKGNRKKTEQLGMPHGTASGQLRKAILFDLACKLGLNMCHRCGKEIKTKRELSIDHIKKWLDSDDPIGLFFDLGNISFSHLCCNAGASSGKSPYVEIKHGTHNGYSYHGCRCERCVIAHKKYQRKWRKK